MRLPQHLDPADFDVGFRVEHAAWRAAIVEVSRAHQLDGERVVAFADGSNLVALVDDRWIVKIFPPFHRHQWEGENRVLARLRGEPLPLRVPTLLAAGIRDDGWPYVIMERLQGVALSACSLANTRPSICSHILAMLAGILPA